MLLGAALEFLDLVEPVIAVVLFSAAGFWALVIAVSWLAHRTLRPRLRFTAQVDKSEGIHTRWAVRLGVRARALVGPVEAYLIETNGNPLDDPLLLGWYGQERAERLPPDIARSVLLGILERNVISQFTPASLLPGTTGIPIEVSDPLELMVQLVEYQPESPKTWTAKIQIEIPKEGEPDVRVYA